MSTTVCAVCGTPLRAPRRKYCTAHGNLASLLWKREQRRKWKQAGDAYWESDWKNKTSEERRAYFREYMRAYRRRKGKGRRFIAHTRDGLLGNACT